MKAIGVIAFLALSLSLNAEPVSLLDTNRLTEVALRAIAAERTDLATTNLTCSRISFFPSVDDLFVEFTEHQPTLPPDTVNSNWRCKEVIVRMDHTGKIRDVSPLRHPSIKEVLPHPETRVILQQP